MFFMTSRCAPWLVVGSLLGTIIIGACLFHFPGILKEGVLSWGQASLLSTSATCVTGIIPISYDALTCIGKILLLVLVELGGVGLTALLVALALALARAGLQWHGVAAYLFDTANVKKIKKLMWIISFTTLFFQFFGAFCLYGVGKYYKIGLSFFDSFFQAVNLFCNAGFLFPETSLYKVILTPLGLFIGSILIIAGSIGFLYFLEIYEYLTARRRGERYLFSPTFRAASSLYFWTFLVAFIVFWVNIRETMTIAHSLLWSFFHASSLRGCGVGDVFFLQNISGRMLFFVVLYSFFGGAPLSTSSGIKTSVLGVILATGRALLKASKQIIVYGRSIITDCVLKAHFFLIYIGILLIVLSLLLEVCIQNIASLTECFITIASCLSNSGILNSLYESPFAKLLLIISMFLGRLGMLVFLFRVRPERDVVQYPNDRLILI